jgi:hypothetical protein
MAAPTATGLLTVPRVAEVAGGFAAEITTGYGQNFHHVDSMSANAR